MVLQSLSSPVLPKTLEGPPAVEAGWPGNKLGQAVLDHTVGGYQQALATTRLGIGKKQATGQACKDAVAEAHKARK